MSLTCPDAAKAHTEELAAYLAEQTHVVITKELFLAMFSQLAEGGRAAILSTIEPEQNTNPKTA